MRYALSLLAFLLRRTMLFVIHMAGEMLGRLFYWQRGERYRISLVHFNLIFPEKTLKQKQELLRASLIESGKMIAEMLVYWSFPSDLFAGLIRDVYGEQYIKEAQAEGRGVILICPHVGNWEVFNMYAGRLPVTTAYKPLRMAWLDRWVKKCRQRHGARLMPLTTTGIRVLYQELKQSKLINIAADQLPDGKGQVVVPYFGVPAGSGIMVSRLLQKSNAVAVCGYAERLTHGRGFDIHLFPVSEGAYANELKLSVATLNKDMEACVRCCPEQYLWEYKRFKYTIDPELYRSKN